MQYVDENQYLHGELKKAIIGAAPNFDSIFSLQRYITRLAIVSSVYILNKYLANTAKVDNEVSQLLNKINVRGYLTYDSVTSILCYMQKYSQQLSDLSLKELAISSQYINFYAVKDIMFGRYTGYKSLDDYTKVFFDMLESMNFIKDLDIIKMERDVIFSDKDNIPATKYLIFDKRYQLLMLDTIEPLKVKYEAI